MNALGRVLFVVPALALAGWLSTPPAPDPNAAQVESILSVIDANLANLGDAFTADFQCQCSSQDRTCVDGKVKARGKHFLRLDGGSAGYQYVHDSREFNWRDQELGPGHVSGRQWNEEGVPGAGFPLALYSIGMVDPRGILGAARTVQASLVVAADPVEVGGVSYTVVGGGGLTLWVQSDNPKRLMAAEWITEEGATKFRAEFGGWAARNAAGGELPTMWRAVNFDEQVQQIEWIYSLSNVETGVVIPPEMFRTVGMPAYPR